jgi:hypothetical protein
MVVRGRPAGCQPLDSGAVTPLTPVGAGEPVGVDAALDARGC